MYDIIKRIIAFLLPIIRAAALEVASDVVNDMAYPNRRRVMYPYSSYNRIPRTSYSQRPRGYTDMIDYAKKDADETMSLYEDESNDEAASYTFPVRVVGHISKDVAREALQHHLDGETHPCYAYTIHAAS